MPKILRSAFVVSWEWSGHPGSHLPSIGHPWDLWHCPVGIHLEFSQLKRTEVTLIGSQSHSIEGKGIVRPGDHRFKLYQLLIIRAITASEKEKGGRSATGNKANPSFSAELTFSNGSCNTLPYI